MLSVVVLLIVVLVTTHILDHYSTKTLLNIEVLWHENPTFRAKMNELRLKEDPLDMEKNRLVRKIIKKFGINKGLRYMSFLTAAMFGFLGGSLYQKAEMGLLSYNEALIWCGTVFFLSGFIFHQFTNAIGSKRRMKKVLEELKGEGVE